MKKYLLVFSFLFVFVSLFGQNKNWDHSLVVEVIPFSHKFSDGTGLNVSYQLEKKRFCHSITLGFNYFEFETNHSQYITNFNGDPDRYSTSVDYEIDEDFPYLYESNINGKNDYEILQNYGLSNLKPALDYRLQRYLTYEFLGKVLQNKINIYVGLGLSLGLTNTSYTVYSMDGFIVKDDKNALVEDFWVRFSVRAKYLYVAPTTKLIIEYPINDRLDLGISGGLHFLLDREFKAEDYSLSYLGIRAKVKI